jgi:hypothetical protein
MAATPIVKSRPTFVSADLPADSRLNCLVMLFSVVSPTMRKSLIKMGHQLISTAKSMKDLGFSEMTYVTWRVGLCDLTTGNTNNYQLTLKVLMCDEGLYAHLLNKVSKLVTSKVLSRKDHLGMMDCHREWVRDDLYPMDKAGETCLLGRPAVDAVVNYTNVMMGYTD